MTLESIRKEIIRAHEVFGRGYKPFTPYIGMKYLIEIKFKNYHVFISDLQGIGVCELSIKDNNLHLICHTVIDEMQFINAPENKPNLFVCSLHGKEVITLDF